MPTSEGATDGIRHPDRRRRGRHPRDGRRHSCRTTATARAWRATRDEALKAIEERRPQLVILDIWLQGSRLDGLEVLNIIKKAHPDLPVVIISGHGNIETAVTAIKRGAYDYIEKPFKADRLLLVTLRALEASKLQREVQRAARALESSAPT